MHKKRMRRHMGKIGLGPLPVSFIDTGIPDRKVRSDTSIDIRAVIEGLTKKPEHDGLRGGSLRPQKHKYKFILELLKLLNEGASLKVKAPGVELSAGGVVAIVAAAIFVLFLVG